ncbi:hypothetical protein SDC9_81437 [bioreactor metagenome]|uniref:Uncharacterized protein n=1 Tax=bioreactor metagenome TaxID=1076179 RepID=A0A644Z2M4_9ZZZZ
MGLRAGVVAIAVACTAVACQALLHCLEQFLHGDGLFEERECADACGFDGRVDGGVAAHHDDGHGEHAGCGPFLEQRDTVGVGHPDVEQHQIVDVILTSVACLGGVLCEVYAVPLVVQDFRQQVPDTQFVVNHQNVCHVF